jgi:SRSO17 transposase
MPVVAEIPKDLEKALEVFRPLFGAPAFEHFKRYVLGLIVSENLTVEGINRVFIDAKHPSSLNRFLTAGIWPQHDLNKRRIDMLKAKGALAGKVWLVIDDTYAHKTGEKIEAVGFFWDHCEKRHVLAHNMVAMEVVNQKGESHPLDFQLYMKKVLCQEKKIPFKTKIELARELVEYALGLGLEIQGVLFDSWYGSKEFIGFLRDNGLHWITRLKSDRNIKIRGEYVQISEFAKTLPQVAFRDIRIGESVYHVFSKAVDLKGVGQVRILISYDNEECSGDPVYFATDQVRWEGTRILKTYGKRSKIEAFFRDSKQNLGFEDYQLRDLRGIKRHWYLIFLAYSLLVSGLSGITRNVPKGSPTLGDLVKSSTRNVFADLVDWVALHVNRGQSTEDICRMAYGF